MDDIEMPDADDSNDSDVDSLASTAPSEQCSAYEVESILAERRDEDGPEYLVKWAGYNINRSTWEPFDSFDSEETLRDWNKRKSNIQKGTEAAFDVALFERQQDEEEARKEERRKARLARRNKAAKRNRGHTPEDSDNRPMLEDPHPESLPSAMITISSPKLNNSPALLLDFHHERELSVMSTSSTLFVQQEPTQNKNVSSSLLGNTSGSAPRPPLLSAIPESLQKKVTSSLRDNKSGSGSRPPSSNEPSTLNRRQSTSVGPKEQQTLSTRKPTIATGSHLPRNGDASQDKTSEPVGKQAPVPSVLALPAVTAVTFSGFGIGRPIIAPRGKTARRGRFPVRQVHEVNRVPDPSALSIMRPGPEKTDCGPMRVYGTPLAVYEPLSKLKSGPTTEMWFKEEMTAGDFAFFQDSRSINHRPLCHAWLEGLKDANAPLFRKMDSLRNNGRVAIFRLGNNSQIWMAYSPNSEDVNRIINPHSTDHPTGPVSFTVLGVPSASSDPRRQILEHHGISDSRVGTGSTEAPAVPIESLSAPRRQILEFQGESNDSAGQGRLEELSSMDMDISPTDAAPATIDSIHNTSAKTRAAFFEGKGISIDTLALSKDGKPVGAFYLHFPAHADQELSLIEAWLQDHKMKFWSSRSYPGDWDFLVNNIRRGAVIFHEDYIEIETLRPRIRNLLTAEWNFWTINLSKSICFIDQTLHPQDRHFQAIFPWGTAILVTEVVFKEISQMAKIITWLMLHDPYDPKLGPLHLFLPPNAKEIVKAAQDKSDLTFDYVDLGIVSLACEQSHHGEGIAMHHLRNTIDTIDRNCIDNSVSGKEDSSVPLDEQKDRLVEAFAGLTLYYKTRIRKSFIIADAGEERTGIRPKWGHVRVLGYDEFFRGFLETEDSKIRKYIARKVHECVDEWHSQHPKLTHFSTKNVCRPLHEKKLLEPPHE
ncbi:hypothetical protein N7495_007632 [Penicillium taxi]|uniref:uncharacterized protein n=1 Tax=Penicillium taxi TaxID=168475 RepID=UPI0025457BEE|nr:uncharacterized protein N7495_007632 [Penicillium taxi]KAJ5887591.1 hypothetical protein N7495_007632 [Penicillium taxi]